MSAGSTTPHLELHLQQDIDRLRQHVFRMGQMASRAIVRATRALLHTDTTEAEAVILRDRLIDQLESDGERLGLEMLVRHQPVGRTLRFIHASLRIIRELERIGDYAESIARQVLRVSRLDPPPQAVTGFEEQCHLAAEMLERALHAYRDEDEALAKGAIPMEQTADQLRDRVRDELLARQQGGGLSVPGLTALLTVARRLERVTDQGKNICEEIVFLCTGRPLRHPHLDTFQILFVDDTQSCLGHLAEAVGRHHAGANFTFHSAGMRPNPPDPRTLEFLRRRGVDVSTLFSRSLGQVPSPEDHHLLIALTEGARAAFPLGSVKTLCLHWPMVEPTRLPDPDAVERSLESAWDSLEQRLAPLLAAVQRD